MKEFKWESFLDGNDRLYTLVNVSLKFTLTSDFILFVTSLNSSYL